MPGFQAPHGGTIPPDVLVTNLRPDMCIVDDSARMVVIFELTCPWDANIERSHSYKEEKYAPLIADLSTIAGYTVYNFSVEVSARGQITKANRARLKGVAFRCCTDAGRISKLLTKLCSKAALLASFSIFCARREPSWMSPAPLVAK